MSMKWGTLKTRSKFRQIPFREQLPKAVEMMQAHKDKKIVMYCTGGIRCGNAWMKHNGFNKVWHIKTSRYARKAREQGLPVRFIGKNFVFDERMGERIWMRILARATSAARRATAIPTVKMMAATCCLFSVQYARKNTKVVVVRFAAKNAFTARRTATPSGRT